MQRGEFTMKSIFANTLAVLAATLVIFLAPMEAEASHCSNAATAGNWAYTYTGTILTQSGPLPAAAVGHYRQDSAGNISGGQARTVAGNSGVEDISGTVAVNSDCTATATINVLVNGQLQRTAVLALVYDSNENHVRMIFLSLTLPDNTHVPVVLTVDGDRLFSKD
jgi:hypothetical protein